MEVYVDLIIVAVLALTIFLGYRKGLIGSAIKIASFFIAIIVSLILYKPVSQLIITQTTIDDQIKQTIESKIDLSQYEEKEGNTEAEPTSSNVITEYIQNSIEEATTTASQNIAKAVSEDLTITIIRIIVMLLLFIITKIILLFVKVLADLVTKIPGIKQFDKAGGILYGAIKGVLMIYIVFAIISLLEPMLGNATFITYIQQSFIGSFLYHHNLILKIVF